jgi:hypothetical protein
MAGTMVMAYLITEKGMTPTQVRCSKIDQQNTAHHSCECDILEWGRGHGMLFACYAKHTNLPSLLLFSA